jgi:hypothetical protein
MIVYFGRRAPMRVGRAEPAGGAEVVRLDAGALSPRVATTGRGDGLVPSKPLQARGSGAPAGLSRD